MRRVVGVVMDGHSGRDSTRNMAGSNQFEIVFRDFIVRAFYFDSDALAGLEQYAVGADFNIEFINLIGFEGVSPGVQMDRLPGLGCGGVEFSLRSAEPAARQESEATLNIEMP